MRISGILKTITLRFHLAVSKSYFTARLYIEMLGAVLRTMPDHLFKKNIVNSINSVKWPDMKLAPRSVKIGSRTIIKIIPHFHEFDFESVVSKRLGYEKETFDYLETSAANYDAIIEIGANVGVFSIFFSQILPKGEGEPPNIFIFEPSIEAYKRLLKNVEINKAFGLRTFNCAVGDTVGFQDFFEPEGHLTNGTLRRDFAEIFSMSIKRSKVITINGCFLENLVSDDKRVLIKIDTEGSEEVVIRSMEKLIKTRKPALLVEVLPDYENELNGLRFLFDLGYKFFNITDKGLIEHQRFDASRFRDYILLPQ